MKKDDFVSRAAVSQLLLTCVRSLQCMADGNHTAQTYLDTAGSPAPRRGKVEARQ